MPQVKSFSAKKQLRVSFTLANGATFEGTDANTLIVTGLRCIVNVKAAGASAWTAASVQIFGMRQSDMNALTMLAWKSDAMQRNRMIVEANDGSGWRNVFSGTIFEAGPDYSAMPDVALHVQATALFLESLVPNAPTSYPNPADAATIVSNLAAAMGRVFENNGVDVTLPPMYLAFTYPEQLRKVAEAAGIDIYDDGEVLAICPRGQPRRTPEVRITSSSGLVAQPTIDAQGVQLQTLYNPAYRFGGPVTIADTDIPRANGRWFIYALDHFLESERPGGAWFSSLSCSEFPGLSVAQ